jgi:hypothetical protein
MSSLQQDSSTFMALCKLATLFFSSPLFPLLFPSLFSLFFSSPLFPLLFPSLFSLLFSFLFFNLLKLTIVINSG